MASMASLPKLTNPQWVLIGLVAVGLLYKFDMLPKMLSKLLDDNLPASVRNLLKPSKKIIVEAPLVKETPLPDGLKCEAIPDDKQCSLYPSACRWMENACKPVEIKKQA